VGKDGGRTTYDVSSGATSTDLRVTPYIDWGAVSWFPGTPGGSFTLNPTWFRVGVLGFRS